jgi:hypothetical protein
MASHKASQIAKALTQYTKPIPSSKVRPMELQLREYYGLGDYHCIPHQNLAEKLKIMRQSYAEAESLEVKQKVAKIELELWVKYINERLEVLADSFKLKATAHARLQKIWNKFLNRGEDTVECSRFLEFHNLYIDEYNFEIPIDDRSLMEMLHPHYGYLTNLPVRLNFNQLLKFYALQSLASFERLEGEELLARQLSALNYWRCVDTADKGIVNLTQFNQLLQAFKLPELNSKAEIERTFAWTLKELPNELNHMDEAKGLLRFELVRRIFLERNF